MADKRTKKLTVRMSEEEWRKAQALAERTNRPLAVLMRNWAIGEGEKLSCHHRPATIVHSADPELLRNIARIGNNINQIARHFNAKRNELTRDEMLDALITLKALEDDLSLLAEAEAYTHVD